MKIPDCTGHLILLGFPKCSQHTSGDMIHSVLCLDPSPVYYYQEFTSENGPGLPLQAFSSISPFPVNALIMNSSLKFPRHSAVLYTRGGSSFVKTLLLTSTSFLAAPQAQCGCHIPGQHRGDSGEGGEHRSPLCTFCAGMLCHLLHPACLSQSTRLSLSKSLLITFISCPQDRTQCLTEIK